MKNHTFLLLFLCFASGLVAMNNDSDSRAERLREVEAYRLRSVERVITNNPGLPEEVKIKLRQQQPSVSEQLFSYENETAYKELLKRLEDQAQPLDYEAKDQKKYQQLIEEHKRLGKIIPDRNIDSCQKLMAFHDTLAHKLAVANSVPSEFFITSEQKNHLEKLLADISQEIATTKAFQLLAGYIVAPKTLEYKTIADMRYNVQNLLDRFRVFNPSAVDCQGNTIGHLLVCANFADRAQKLFTSNPATINVLNKKGESPFHVAVTQDDVNTDLILWMIEHCDLLPDSDGYTALHYVARRYPKFIPLVIQKQKVSINALSNDRETPLSIAAFFDAGQGIQALLAQPGIDVNLPDKDGYTPLDKALMSNSPSSFGINELIKVGGKMSTASRRGISNLSGQDQSGHKLFQPLVTFALSITESMFTLNPESIPEQQQSSATITSSSVTRSTKTSNAKQINEKVQKKINTLILQNNLVQLKKVLLANKDSYDFNQKCQGSPSALMYAVETTNKPLVELLLSLGADSNYSTENDTTVLALAVRGGKHELVDLLCANGANPNQVLKLGIEHDNIDVPLIYFAVLFSTDAVVKKLIARGALYNVRTNGLTPLHVALKFGNIRNAVALVQAGASIHASSSSGNTPLHSVAQHGAEKKDYFAVTAVLLQNGALRDLYTKNSANLTPLECAVISKNTQFITQCLTYGLKSGQLRVKSDYQTFVDRIKNNTIKLMATTNGLLTLVATA